MFWLHVQPCRVLLAYKQAIELNAQQQRSFSSRPTSDGVQILIIGTKQQDSISWGKTEEISLKAALSLFAFQMYTSGKECPRPYITPNLPQASVGRYLVMVIQTNSPQAVNPLSELVISQTQEHGWASTICPPHQLEFRVVAGPSLLVTAQWRG